MVRRIKVSLKDRAASASGFRNEFSGSKILGPRQSVEAHCWHGLVTNELAAALRARGLQIDNDRNRDLVAVTNDNSVSALFEVKSDCDLYSVYTGIGQLMYHGKARRESHVLVFVSPEPRDIVKTALKKLGINVLHYEIADEKPAFKRLDKLLRDLKITFDRNVSY